MENRRTIRNWDAFGHLERLMTRFMLTDLFDPVLKLVLNFFSVILLGVTFVYQSVAMLIALDVVFVAIYQSASAQLSRAFAAIMFFLPNERERTASISGLVKFYSNVMWVRIVYNLHKDCFVYMSAGPLLVMALMQTLISFYTERLATEQSALTQGMYSSFLFTLFLMVFNAITHAPDYLLLETVLLLRSPIDALCNSVDTVFRVCDSTLGSDNAMPVYTTQIARYSFWSAVHLLLLMVVWSSAPDSPSSALSHRADKFLYFTLFMHDLLDLFIPLRQLLIQVRNEQYVAKNFPRLSATELSAVSAETCSVCLCEHNPRTVRLRCNHLLHAQCLQRILQQSVETRNPDTSRCPMCRAPIELPPTTSTRSAVFGTGTRGNRNVQATVTIPFFGSLTARHAQATNEQQAPQQQQQRLQRADGTGGPMRAEQLIAEHLGQQNLQQGDLIHIRIIPRSARAGLSRSATATAAAPATTPAPVTSTQATPTSDGAAALPAAPSESNLSALHAIHRDFLYSNDTSRSPSASSISRVRSPLVRGATSTGTLSSLVETAMLPPVAQGGDDISTGSGESLHAAHSPATQIPQAGDVPMDVAADESAADALSPQRAESVDSDSDDTPDAGQKRKWESVHSGGAESDEEIAGASPGRLRQRTAAAESSPTASVEQQSWTAETVGGTTGICHADFAEEQGMGAFSPQATESSSDACLERGEGLHDGNSSTVQGAEQEDQEGQGSSGDDKSERGDESDSDESSVSTAHSSGSETHAAGNPKEPGGEDDEDEGSDAQQDQAQSPQIMTTEPVARSPPACEDAKKQVQFVQFTHCVDLTLSDDEEEVVIAGTTAAAPAHSSLRGDRQESPDRPLSGVKRSREDGAGTSSSQRAGEDVGSTQRVSTQFDDGPEVINVDEDSHDAASGGELGGVQARKLRRSGGALAYTTQCSSDSSSGNEDE